jgi:CRP/FNR family cyclic AMP-dependent transcriptional regulator
MCLPSHVSDGRNEYDYAGPALFLMSIHVNFLKRFALLRDLPAASLEEIAALMTMRTVARRGVALQKGEAGQGLGFLLEGHLQGVDFTLDGREVGLYFVNPGDYFGELPVADRLPPPEFVIALAKSEILTLPQDAARRLLFSTPAIAEQVVLRLAKRVRTATEQRNLLSLPNPMQRLCAQLLLMCEGDAHEIAHAPTHQELAIMINTTRETVTRNFQVLQSRRLLLREGERITLAQAATLQQLAEGGKLDTEDGAR